MLALLPRLLYLLAFSLCRLTMLAGFAYRSFGVRYVPASGGVLLACTHQSHLDPILVGIALDRPLHFMGRASLFEFPVFGSLIRLLNAFPVRRAAADLEALREALRRLKAGHPVLMFPEGTRTTTGAIGPIHAGVVLLAARAGVPIVPVAIHGAFEAWPRRRSFPRPHPVRIRFGEPIPVPDAEHRDEVLKQLTAALHALQASLRGEGPAPAVSAAADRNETFFPGRGPNGAASAPHSNGPHSSIEANA